MPRPIAENDLSAIEEAVGASPDAATAQQIAQALNRSIPQRTLQYRLKRLVQEGRVIQEGSRRWAKYRIPAIPQPESATTPAGQKPVSISRAAAEIRKYLHQPITARKPVGYRREFLESYRPDVDSYLSSSERAHLLSVGTPATRENQPAGTYAKHILNRLLIDLSWNSSRLEGNAYSLLDTKRLIDFGQEAEGKSHVEAQMILNHKDAIEFLVGSAEDIGFNRYTILNLHALLANNLLADPTAPGRLRHIPVGIEHSTFHPLEVPQLIEGCFDQILSTANAITDPFEQLFFMMVQLPYLQPFDDVNKRVSRLAANIPLIRRNLVPLAFVDLPRDLYTDALFGVYELNKTDLLRDVVIWAYERSAARYAAVKQSLGEPDPFRLRYRERLRELVRDVILQGLNRQSAAAHILRFAKDKIEPADRDRFREIAEDELLALHGGNFARYRIRPSDFQEWQKKWKLAPAGEILSGER